ncbi:MAG: DNA alkylation repair protein [Lachnospiraceae bacterium]|nr:DNA alkylation repair protein [Lachnospiraceae bacterium]
MIKEEIRDRLFAESDEKYAKMQEKIIPTVAADSIIGVRTPALRKFAKELAKRDDVSDFLDDLPHKYFDENQLHAFIVSEMKDYESCVAEVTRFLPYVDNWATCDQMSPKVFKKHRQELVDTITDWIGSNRPYTIRFGIGMLMEHFLDEDYDIKYPEIVAKVRSEEYYVNMMIAWYFATALAKQYDTILPFIEKKKLEAWTHNKAIQKSVESYRITPEQKEYLKSLKIKKEKKG